MGGAVHKEGANEGMTRLPALMVPKGNSLESITVIRHVLITGEGFCREKVTFSVTWPPGCVSVNPFCLIFIITFIIIIYRKSKYVTWRIC